MLFNFPSQHQPGIGVDLERLISPLASALNRSAHSRGITSRSNSLEEWSITVASSDRPASPSRYRFWSVGAVGLPLGFVADDLRQALVPFEYPTSRMRSPATPDPDWPDHRLDRLFGAGRTSHQHPAPGRVRSQPVERIEATLLINKTTDPLVTFLGAPP